MFKANNLLLFKSLTLTFLFFYFFSFKNYNMGQGDFAQYWSAIRIFWEGNNPYLPEVMQEFQLRELGRPTPMMMWNPPWVLIFLYPILIFDFELAAKLWFFSQIIFYFLGSYIVLKTIEDRYLELRVLIATIVLSLIFPPIIGSLHLGQLGGLLFFATTLIYYGVVRNNFITLLVGGLLLSVKPHIGFLLGVCLLWWFIKNHRYRIILSGIFLFLIMLSLSDIVLRGSISDWVNAVNFDQNYIIPTQHQWLSITFMSLISMNTGIVGPYYGILITLFFSVLFSAFLIIYSPNIIWKFTLPWILAASIFFSPMAWLSDYSILLVCHIIIILNCIKFKRWLLLILVLSFQIFTQYSLGKLFYYHHQFWWFPIILMVFYLFAARPLRGADS